MKHIGLCILVLLMLCSCSKATYESYTDTAQVNGVILFYAVEGRGKPVIMLHGNGGSHTDLETAQRQLAQAGYKVYALDSRGQGANKPLPEYHYIDMAQDVYQFIQAKGLKRPAVYGFSDGGIIALQLEVLHPGTCGLIAASGANVFPDSPQRRAFAGAYKRDEHPTPLNKMVRDEPNITQAQLRGIACPVLVLAGEHDLIADEHTRYIARCIPHSTLKIVPGATHGSYIVRNPQLGNILIDYLKQQGY